MRVDPPLEGPPAAGAPPPRPRPRAARAVRALAGLIALPLAVSTAVPLEARAQAGLARLTPAAVELVRPITFVPGTSTLDPAGEAVLRAVAQILSTNGAVTLEIGAHTDSRGAEAFNLAVSQERADAVRAFLVRAGIAPGRLRAVGYGESVPIDTNSTAAGRERNRRIELVRTDVRRP